MTIQWCCQNCDTIVVTERVQTPDFNGCPEGYNGRHSWRGNEIISFFSGTSSSEEKKKKK